MAHQKSFCRVFRTELPFAHRTMSPCSDQEVNCSSVRRGPNSLSGFNCCSGGSNYRGKATVTVSTFEVGVTVTSPKKGASWHMPGCEASARSTLQSTIAVVILPLEHVFQPQKKRWIANEHVLKNALLKLKPHTSLAIRSCCSSACRGM